MLVLDRTQGRSHATSHIRNHDPGNYKEGVCAVRNALLRTATCAYRTGVAALRRSTQTKSTLHIRMRYMCRRIGPLVHLRPVAQSDERVVYLFNVDGCHWHAGHMYESLVTIHRVHALHAAMPGCLSPSLCAPAGARCTVYLCTNMLACYS